SMGPRIIDRATRGRVPGDAGYRTPGRGVGSGSRPGGTRCGIMDAMDTSSTASGRSSLWRSRGAVLASLCAAAVGAGGMGAVVSQADSNPEGAAAAAIEGVVPSTNPRALSGPAWASAAPG